jgi:triosephosphate isomerase
MSKKLIVANWKMHLDLEHSLNLVEQLDQRITASAKTEIVLCPAFIALAPLKQQLKKPKFKLGAQDLFYVDEGLFTGEVSGTMLRDLVDYVIVGHSERRRNFSETDVVVARKMSAALRNDIIPILCIGESLEQREAGEALRVLHDQLTGALMMLTPQDISGIVITYEPPDAISSGDGHGAIAEPERITQALQFIHKTITQLYGKTATESIRLLYGGSVNADFIKEYLTLKELDGFLVGGASLNYEEFSRLVKIVRGHTTKSKKP